MDVADPLGFFFDGPREAKPEPQAEPPPAKRPKSRSSGSGSCEDDTTEARVRRLRRRIEKYVERNRLDHHVSGIMLNMHPSDVIKVMETPFPEDCRNPSGFAVAQIRRTERDNGRPKDYRWNGRSWREGTRDASARSPRGGDRGRGRDRESGRAGQHPGHDRSRARRQGHSRSKRRSWRTRRRKHSRSRSPGSTSGSSSCSGSSYSRLDGDSRGPGRRRRR